VILDAARRTIREHGPDVTLEEIADAANVGKPKIYAHFNDKAGLADALAVEVAHDIESRTVSKLGDGAVRTPADLYRISIDAFTKFVADDTNLYRFMVRSIKGAEADVFDNALLPALQSRTAVLIELVYPDMDAASREVASYASIGQAFAACEGWLQHRRFSRRKLVDSLVTLFLQGVPALVDDEAGRTTSKS
jgi:AcrR family transcriptional regulator